jgi:hypothetical protein
MKTPVLAVSMLLAMAVPILATMAPSLPQATVDVTMPTHSGSTIVVNAGEDLQAALNAANPGDVIQLAAGATFTGTFVVPNKPTDATHWIVIRTSGYASLPASGTRIAPTDAANMAKIRTTTSDPALNFANGAKYYRLIGLEVDTDWTSQQDTQWVLVCLGRGHDCSTDVTDVANLPHDIVLDRLYLHGTDTGNIRRGILGNAANIAVVDSYISNIHEIGADSQAFAAWNGSGPFLLKNSYFEGAGENVMFGGSDPSIKNLVPADITIQQSLFDKPLSWRAGDPTYAGNHWSVKNLLELKNAHRVLIEGNTFQHCWADSQVGFAILFTPRNQSGTAPWSVVQDVTFRHNTVRNVGSGINILGTDNEYPSQRTDRIAIANNLFYLVSGSLWGGDGKLFQILGGAHNLSLRHNTGDQTGLMLSLDGEPPNADAEFIDNILSNGSHGIYGSGYGRGAIAMGHFLPGVIWHHNALPGASWLDYFPWHTRNNWFPWSMRSVGFTDLANHNYLVTSGSTLHNAGSDGTDVGVNYTTLNAAQAVGLPSPSPSPSPTLPGALTPSPTPTRTALLPREDNHPEPRAPGK